MKFAILHGETEIADGRCSSDVDIVTHLKARDLLKRTYGELRASGLHPVVLWPYDVGSASVFIVDEAARDGVQFDILYDRTGTGHYGVKSDAVLARMEPGARWPRARHEDELLYLIRKRQYKGQRDRLADLVRQSQSYPGDALRSRAGELFSQPSAAAVIAALAGADQAPDRLRTVRESVNNVGRMLSRIMRPVGFWAAFTGPHAQAAAGDISARFERVLPVSGCGRTGADLAKAPSHLRRLAPVRWRAGLYCSWGPVPPGPSPDLIVECEDGHIDRAARAVVAGMEQRLAL